MQHHHKPVEIDTHVQHTEVIMLCLKTVNHMLISSYKSKTIPVFMLTILTIIYSAYPKVLMSFLDKKC